MKRRLVVLAFALALVSMASLLAAFGAGAGSSHARGGSQVRAERSVQALIRTARLGGLEQRGLLISSLAPSLPTDPALHGVSPGGLPWVLDRGFALVLGGGRIIVSVHGLVIPVAHGTFPPGTARPVTTVSASLYCGADSVTTPAATTKAVDISASGNATIVDKVTVPPTCLAPIVLVHPNGGLGAYIAVTGFRP